MPKILVVEDESVIRSALRRLLERNDYNVSEAASVQEAESRHNLNDFDLIISDLRLPGAPGTDLIKKAGEVPVLIMTSYASLRSAVDSMRMGAVDYIAKPFDHSDMLGAVERIIADHPTPRAESARDAAREHREPGSPRDTGLLGNCPAMQSLFRSIKKVAPTDSTVLVLGETGTGKELVARSVHQYSKRADKTLVSVNCAAIPDTLIESELFGYEKGAFTGANASRMGLIEAADGGTLFLDEIGELPMEAQARLLRFIQEGEIRRIGSVTSRKVNVRLICATHRNLQALAAESQFRQDLYYRINVLRLSLPPLRERGKDILHLAERMLETQIERLGKNSMQLSPKAIQAITTYQWPGNVRELEHAIERAVVLSEGDEIDNEALGIDLELVNINRIRGEGIKSSAPQQPRNISSDPQEDLSLEDYFQRFVLEHQDSMSETELAQKLGISRKCLWERRQRFDIPRKKSGATGAGRRKKAAG
ncbi:sigma-54-dependent transcriptional regulator [Parahaliea mediterranea]|uniref:Sigma-54-dependent Fis family transcriptional regulator n=1 Tax=Parahaliea mediterranea TaxID=651086 RepID=A0A939IHQ6_9GAMM|nr:sigma-54 dependent transcriptional regulator [Parahaliea mediterranea]MBN7795779.1 sigma-54-dependent Fis family transcriptional regulator [Parahaliea mediterranea]